MYARGLFLVVLSAFPISAQTKHPFTFEDMMALERVEEPQVSPDGKWVLFAAVDVDLKANTKMPHVWVVPLNRDSNVSKNQGDPSTSSGQAMGHPISDQHARSSEENKTVPRFSPALREVGYSKSQSDTPEQKAGSSTTQNDSQANHPASVGITDHGDWDEKASKEREIISDQDADRPRWAPDGKRFAFVSSKEAGSQIWIADFDGATGTVTAKHRLTNIATEADGELWSPDGKNILFKSDVWPECDGTPESEAACNAKKVEEKKNSRVKAQIITHLLYRHWNAFKEGKRTHLLIFSVVACEVGVGVGTGHVGPDAPVRAGEPPSPAAEPSSAGRVGAPAPTRDEEGSAACSVARDLTPGDYDAPVFSLGGQGDYAFSPDGQETCYASNHDPEPAISTNNDLFTVPVNFPADATSKDVLAATKNITAENKAADDTPLYSPDGKYIAYRAQQRPGYESDRWRLMLYDRKTGKPRLMTESLDAWPGSFAWSPDSKRMFFAYDSQGESPVASFEIDRPFNQTITVDGSAAETARYNAGIVVRDGHNDDLAMTPDGRHILFTRMSVSFPNEIFETESDATIADRLAHPPEKLSHLNGSVLSQVSTPPLETFWFSGAHGDKVQGWIVKPPNFDSNKKYPVKFIVHGGPEVPMGDEWSYRWNFELFAANGCVVVFINFHGSPGYGQKFIDAINGDWGGAPFEDLMKGLDYAEQHYPFINKDRECALGASYGGYMANWILGHTNRFKCIVTHDGMFNTESAWGTTEELWFNEWEFKGTPFTNRDLYRKWSPHLFATNFKTPTLVIHSQLDYRLDVSQGFDLFTTLQRQGVPSKMLYFPDEGHWVLKPQNSQLWYKTVNDWVDQWVGK